VGILKARRTLATTCCAASPDISSIEPDAADVIARIAGSMFISIGLHSMFNVARDTNSRRVE
jgi:hypothetical protein